MSAVRVSWVGVCLGLYILFLASAVAKAEADRLGASEEQSPHGPHIIKLRRPTWTLNAPNISPLQ